MNRRARTVVTVAAALTALPLVACSGSKQIQHAGDAGRIRSNPSPAMMSLAKRPSDNANSIAIMKDTNLRMFWEDGARVLHLDRPSNLSPKPIPH